jgi:outer membrane protein
MRYAGSFHVLALLMAAVSVVHAQTNDMPPRRLSLAEAMDIAANANAEVVIATEKVREAGGRVDTERGALLPELRGQVSQTRQERSTAAYGLPEEGIATPDPIQTEISYPGTPDSIVRKYDLPTSAVVDSEPTDIEFDFSDTTGPYNFFNAKLNLTVPLIDVQNIQDYKTATTAEKKALYDRDASREEAMLQAASLYQGVLFSAEAVEVLRKKVELHEQRVTLSEDLARSGVSTALDVKKEKVTLNQVRNQLKQAELQYTLALRELKRVLALDPEEPVELTDPLEFRPLTAVNVREGLQKAFQDRPDYRAQKQQEKVTSLQRKAAIGDYYPTLMANGNVGQQGLTPDDTDDAWFIGAFAQVPLFDSFRRRGTIIQQDSQWKQEQTRTRDLEDRIGNEVQQFADELSYHESSVRVADENVMYTDEVLREQTDAKEAGTATDLEVVEAEVDLADAKFARVEAMYNYNLAVAKWFRATGGVRRALDERPLHELWNPGPDADSEEAQDGAQESPP